MAGDSDAVRVLDASAFDAARAGAVVIVDTRSPEAFASGHVPGSLNVWLAGLGPRPPRGFREPEQHDSARARRHPEDSPEAVAALARLGIDGVAGILGGRIRGMA